ncbi:hypothetical protein CcaCcLH18_07389 [Colletotrichum camelliae]|nr:hypothetical protein CcaCcLH18_07389 [Colletotrichum camelliae]
MDSDNKMITVNWDQDPLTFTLPPEAQMLNLRLPKQSRSRALFTISAVPFYFTVWLLVYLFFSLPVTCLSVNFTQATCSTPGVSWLCDAMKKIECGGTATKLITSLFTGYLPMLFGLL